MNIGFDINIAAVLRLKKRLETLPWIFIVIMISFELAALATAYAYFNDYIVTYGDAESHLNIAKRVIHSLTPGIAQLGGIWLPLPHVLMVPFAYFDFLWRTGLAGSIVSGGSFIISCVYLFKTTRLLTKSTLISFVAFLIFATNPNVLYMQATPMTELPLIAFFILSTYYFILFLKDHENFNALVLAGLFGFCASLSRYDGWFLVLFEAFAIIVIYLPDRSRWKELEGKIILFSTIAFFGVILWMMWDYLILGDPFYFTNSQFSAKTQQTAWRARGELPSYQNPILSFLYYTVTAMSNSGIMIFVTAIIGLIFFLKNKKEKDRFLIGMIMMVPFIFYIFTLYVGQSVIFIPHLTPTTFEWTLFNVRYGLMMMPAISFLFAYAFMKAPTAGKWVLVVLVLFQFGLYYIGYSKVITLADGTIGLSHAKRDYAEYWLSRNYDNGLVLLDDYARTISIVRTGIPMQKVIYIGNKPYWDISLERPELYPQWIVMQKNDLVWRALYENPAKQDNLYKYFEKAYTSPNVLIFKRISKFDNRHF